MSKRLWFSTGLVLGAAIGVGAMLIVNARRRPANVPASVPVDLPTLPEPWAGYETSKVDDIKWKLRPLSLAGRAAVRRYEVQRGTGPRRGIINVLDALEAEAVNGNA